MKKPLAAAILALVVSGAFPQETVSLRGAIESAAAKLEQDIPAGKKIAVYDFTSPWPRLSDWVIDELLDTFTNHKRLTVAEQQRLAIVRKEVDYQYVSGEVSDEDILSMTQGSGIDFIITGQMGYDGLDYRFRVYAIDAAKRTRVASTSLYINSKDKQLAFYMGGAPDPQTQRAASQSEGWKNKRWYIGPILGLGLYSYEDSVWKDHYEYGSYNGGYYETATESVMLFAGGVSFQLQAAKFLAFELIPAYGSSEDAGIPVLPLFAELTFWPGSLEINAGVGYTIGLGLSFKASVGFHLGPGILYAMFMDVTDMGSFLYDGNAMLFGAGYKFGLGRR